MPVNSLIVGVDLAPIKPIPRTTIFQGDITSDKCRATIRQHFKTWKADTVLHDGAPNVGTAWVQDAFSQAELALHALKLAAEFLVEGGTFVTKVFRSKDYNALLWVFNQLFSSVEATKPPSSRNVSAEIFVVCRDFKAPKRIDPRLLEPRSVFAELSNPTPNNEAKVFDPEKKKRKREGYEEGDYTQFREAPANEFVQTTDPIAMLGSLNRLHFTQSDHDNIALAALGQLPETTPEVKQCCEDLKVLGRKEFRMLLRWRLKARERFGLASKKSKQDLVSEEITEITPMDAELKIQEELQRLDENQQAKKKKERRRANEKKQKEIVRMQMNMTTPTEIGLEQAGPHGGDSMFTLAAVNRAGAVEKVYKGGMGTVFQKTSQSDFESSEESGTEDEMDGLELDLDTLYQQYQQRRSETDAKFRAKKARAEHGDGEWTGIAESATSSDQDLDIDQLSAASSELSEEGEATSRAQDYDNSESHKRSEPLTIRAALFFEQDVFKDVGVLDAVEVGVGDDESQVHAVSIGGELGETARDIARDPPKRQNGRQTHHVAAEGNSGRHDAPVDPAQSKSSPQRMSKARSQDDPEGNSFEIVPHSDCDGCVGRSEPQRNGRLGETAQTGLIRENQGLTYARYRHHHGRGHDPSSTSCDWQNDKPGPG